MKQFQPVICPTFPGFLGWIMQYPPTIPKFYWDVKSQEQRIKTMCCYINSLVEYVDALNMQDAKNYADLHALIEATKTELEQLIAELTLGQLQWDCQTGTYEPTQTAQRDMFNDVTVHAIDVADLAGLNLTVDELATCGLNVRGLAVMSYWLVDAFELPHQYTDTGNVDADALTVEKLRRAQVRSTDGVVNVPEGVANANA